MPSVNVYMWPGRDAKFKRNVIQGISKLPARKVAGVCCQGWKFTCTGHAPDLSKPDSFDFLCNRLSGAWRSIPASIRVPGQFISGLKSRGFLTT